MNQTKFTKSKRKNRHLQIAVLLIITGTLTAFSYVSTSTSKENHQSTTNYSTISTTIGKEPIFKGVEEMPRFPGCEEGDISEKEQCSNKKLITFIASNLTYPASAKKDGIEGMTVISFVVNKKGKVSKIKVIKSVREDCDEAAIAVIEKMKKEITWIPGKHEGKNVSVEMTLPFRFKLS
jgi:TonB family protein